MPNLNSTIFLFSIFKKNHLVKTLPLYAENKRGIQILSIKNEKNQATVKEINENYFGKNMNVMLWW